MSSIAETNSVGMENSFAGFHNQAMDDMELFDHSKNPARRHELAREALLFEYAALSLIPPGAFLWNVRSVILSSAAFIAIDADDQTSAVSLMSELATGPRTKYVSGQLEELTMQAAGAINIFAVPEAGSSAR